MARHPGHVLKVGSDRFRVRLCVAGARHSYYLRGTDRDAAKEWAKQKHAQLEREATRQASGMLTGVRFSDLLRRFEDEHLPTRAPGTQRSYRDSLRPIRAYFVTERGDPLLTEMRAADIEAFLSWRRVHRAARKGPRERGPLSNRSLAKDRTVLGTIMAMADRLEMRDGNPVRRTKAPKGDARTPVILKPAEYERLVAACDDAMLRTYVVTLGETGTRCESEALWLKWEDVDLDEQFVWVASGRDGHRVKGGKGRWVPMTPRLVTAMREHFARFRFAAYHGTRSEWVFHHTLSRRRHKAGDRIGSLREGFVAAATRAKLPADLHQHDLRHRRVTSWLAEGRDVVKVKEALGHSDLRTTMGYTHLAREHLRALVETVETKASRTASA